MSTNTFTLVINNKTVKLSDVELKELIKATSFLAADTNSPVALKLHSKVINALIA